MAIDARSVVVLVVTYLCVVAAHYVVMAFRQPAPDVENRISDGCLAWLAGGERRLVHWLLFELVVAGALRIDRGRVTPVASNREPPATLMREALDLIGSRELDWTGLAFAWTPLQARCTDEASRRGLVVMRAQFEPQRRYALLGLLVWGAVWLWWAQQAADLLLVGLVVSGWLLGGLWWGQKGPIRRGAADGHVARLKAASQSLRRPAQNGDDLAAEDRSLAAALFGIGVFDAGALGQVASEVRRLEPLGPAPRTTQGAFIP